MGSSPIRYESPVAQGESTIISLTVCSLNTKQDSSGVGLGYFN